MATTPFDSAMLRDLFHDAEIGKLFTDSAEVRAMMIVEGTLAKVQGAAGVIPEISAQAIHRASLEIQIDPGGLSKAAGQNGVVVPAFVAAYRKAMDAPEHAQYMHWGATSQDIIDSGLMLRLKQVVGIYEARITSLIGMLAALAQTHAELPMAARTWGQIATPTSFGAVVAAWGFPLLDHLDRLTELRKRLLVASLSGAAGTSSALGDDPTALRVEFAKGLGLNTPKGSWHSCRDAVAEFAGWLTGVTGTLGKLGEDLLLMAQSGIDEVSFEAGGASSTMPQKSNPVGASLLVALARQVAALNGAMQGAVVHRQQRDGAAWMVEWMSLPQMVMATGKALIAAQTLAQTLSPNPDAMRRNLDPGDGLIYAEALTFALATNMPRPTAQDQVKALCKRVQETGTPLPNLVAEAWPDADYSAVFTPASQLGLAPQSARDFALAAKSL